MRARFLLTALIALPLVAATAHAQTYTIQVKTHPAEGKSFSATETAKINVNFNLATGGNVLKEDKKVEHDEKQFTEKVLTLGAKGPTKFSRTYAKAAHMGREAQNYAGEIKLLEVTPQKKLVWSYRDDRAHGIHEFQILETNGKALEGPPLK